MTTRVTVTFRVPNGDEATAAVMTIEDALPDYVDDFEWDAEDDA